MTTIEEHRPPPINRDSHRACPWRLVRNGLNIEGSCTNSHCPAYEQMVIINIGFGEYDLARIILQRKNHCPMCNERIHPTKYALSQCQWWYVDHYSTHTFSLTTVNDTYLLHDLKCDYIVMEIMPLPSNYRSSTSSQEITCPICFNNIENEGEIVHLRCSHTFHSTCIHRWLQSNQSMANTCPMCRTEIGEAC